MSEDPFVALLRNPRGGGSAIEPEHRMMALAADTIERLQDHLATIRNLVDRQAEDEGIWFGTHQAVEEALRKLHAVVEGEGPP